MIETDLPTITLTGFDERRRVHAGPAGAGQFQLRGRGGRLRHRELRRLDVQRPTVDTSQAGHVHLHGDRDRHAGNETVMSRTLHRPHGHQHPRHRRQRAGHARLTLGAPAQFGAFTPGLDADLPRVDERQRRLDRGRRAPERVRPELGRSPVTWSTARSSCRSRCRRGRATRANTGTAYNNVGSSASPLNLLTWSAPISNDAVTLKFSQLVNANDPLRTDTYSKALTFTLSTTSRRKRAIGRRV